MGLGTKRYWAALQLTLDITRNHTQVITWKLYIGKSTNPEGETILSTFNNKIITIREMLDLQQL